MKIGEKDENGIDCIKIGGSCYTGNSDGMFSNTFSPGDC
jgi:hypothetical protein